MRRASPLWIGALIALSVRLAACAAPQPTTAPTITTPAPSSIPALTGMASPAPQPTIQPSATLTATPTDTPEVATGQVISLHQPLGLSFIDPNRGWLLAAGTCMGHVCPVTLRQTQDGGQTWVGQLAPAAEADFVPYFPWKLTDPTGVSDIRFANGQDGWAYGPSLFSTHDGGQTWVDEHRVVSDLVVVPGAIWAVEQQGTDPVIEQSTDSGQSWVPVLAQPRLVGWPALMSVDQQTAWLYAQDNNGAAQLLITRNGGTSWDNLKPPVSHGCSFPVLAALAPQQLWFVCGSGPATDMQEKSVVTSSDGGSSWTLQANTGPFGATTGSIAIVGVLLRRTDFAATSASAAFMGLDRGNLIMTTDGGRLWRDAIPYDRVSAAGDALFGPVEFVNTMDGWFFVFPNHLFRTTDGGQTWTETAVP